MNKKSLYLVFASIIVFLTLTVCLFSLNKWMYKNEGVEHKYDDFNTENTNSIDILETENNGNIDDTAFSENNGENIEIIPPVTEPVVKNISFIAAGDNIIHQAVIDDAKRRTYTENGVTDSYYFDSMYDNLKDIISSADISFINQEGPIAGKQLGYSGYPSFNAPNQAGDALVNLGFDIVNIANNHMLDRGEAGYINSIEFWNSKPITLIGGYESEEDFNTIRYYEYDGLKIALLSYTYGTNGYYLPSDSTMWIPYYNENDIVNKHSKEARENADIVIAFMHWGDENSFKPNNIQKQYADILVKNNVDVIIGTHPHVLQPIEWRTRPDGGKTLIAYSLGNLLSTMHYSKNMVGGLLKFNISYANPSDAFICDVKLVPTICFYSKNRDSLKMYTLSDFSKEQYYNHGSTLKENISYDTMLSYVTNTIDKEFLDNDFLDLVENNNS